MYNIFFLYREFATYTLNLNDLNKAQITNSNKLNETQIKEINSTYYHQV